MFLFGRKFKFKAIELVYFSSFSS